jgi:CRP-like cAMP-binding protein
VSVSTSITLPGEPRGAAALVVHARDVTANTLLSGLLHAAPSFRPEMEIVRLRSGEVVVERGIAFPHVHFPLDAVLSMLTVIDDGRAVEFATIGREGMSGSNETLTGAGTPMRLIAQVPGASVRIPAAALSELARTNLRVIGLMLRYNQSLLVQAAQIAACNRLHPVEERCARWLLMTHDRVRRDEFLLTQEFLSQMLGVRRARVNVAAGILQRAGVIRYSRGRIRLTDRGGLEAASCECYGLVRTEYDQLASEWASRSDGAV